MALKDILLVYARNIGKGFKKNTQTKQYDVAVGKSVVFNDNGELEINVKEANGVRINSDGTVGVAVSSDEGNQIELRDDGVYYGTTAPVELQNLYVSSSLGNDSNEGTREAPLKTIQAALNKLSNKPQKYTIYLYKNDLFDWVDIDLGNAELSFRVYGAEDDYPDAFPQNTFYRGYLAKSFPRPTIKVGVREWNGRMKRHSLHFNNAWFYGIKFEINNTAVNDREDLPGNFGGFVSSTNGKVEFWGCVINITGAAKAVGSNTYRNDSLTRCKTVVFSNCHTDTGFNPFNDGTTLAYSSIYPSITKGIATGDGNLDGRGVKPNYEVYSTTEFMKKITLDNIAYNYAYDRATKSLFGVNVNFDIFANS